MENRQVLVVAGVAAAVVAVILAFVFFVYLPGGTTQEAITAATPSSSEDGADKIGPDDMVMGSPDAPVTMIEYASMTCGHCAHFHATVLPEVKRDYIDKGLVRLVFREYPLDPVAMAGSVVARCLPKDQYFDFIDVLFRNQKVWAFVDNPREGIVEIAKRAGLGREQVTACLSNEAEINRINQVRRDAVQRYEVNATPTFVINGKVERNIGTYEDLKQVFSAYLPAQQSSAPAPAGGTPEAEAAPAPTSTN